MEAVEREVDSCNHWLPLGNLPMKLAAEDVEYHCGHVKVVHTDDPEHFSGPLQHAHSVALVKMSVLR